MCYYTLNQKGGSMFKDKIIQQSVQKLQAQVVLVHTSRYAYSPREVPEELRCFKYCHKDVLEIINEEHLHLAYQRWRMLSGGYENQIAPIRRVNEIMNTNIMHLKCDVKLVQNIKRVSDVLKIEPEELFMYIMKPFPGLWCTKENMLGMLNIMCTTGMRIK